MFLELDATAAKTGRPVTPVNPKTPADAPRRARDVSFDRFYVIVNPFAGILDDNGITNIDG